MYNSDLPNRADLPTTAQLFRSTLNALGAAIVILVTTVLPAEYGVDPTGIGRLLGLKQMGEIKQQLAEEAALEENTSVNIPSTVVPVDAAPSRPENIEIAEKTALAKPDQNTSDWNDEITIDLAPGAGAEIKLIMEANKTAVFEWTAMPGHLNSALHGNGTQGERTTYRNGRAETGHAGELTAAFDGRHGWFWRNRSKETVRLTLRARGEYSELKRVL